MNNNYDLRRQSSSVLFVDHASAIGGAEQSLLLLLKHINRDQFTLHLACTGGPLQRAAIALSVPTHLVALPRLRRSPHILSDWLNGAKELAYIARCTDTQVFVANTVRAALYSFIAARLARRPFVWYMRDFWLSEGKPGCPWTDTLGKRMLCASAAQVVTNSYAVAKHLPCQSRVTVIHNGLEIERFNPMLGGQEFRQHYDIPPHAPVVGMVGRLRPWKGQERFLRAVTQILAEVPETCFIMVGGDPFEVKDGYSQRLQQMLHELPISNRVVFTDHLADVRPALAALDIFVHPGDPEPFGLVNIEAMAMGKPLVAFAHGALPEIVVDRETGLLVTPGNEQALADAVVRLLQDKPRWMAMGTAGRDRVERAFRIEQTASGVQEVLRQVITTKRVKET